MNHSEKFLISSLNTGNELHTLKHIEEWYFSCLESTIVDIRIIDLSKLVNWSTSSKSISHSSGHFFSILPIDIETNSRITNKWQQPIINQPEFGFLGFICKEINGVLHFLVQAKIEPGNINKVQLSPTLQATKSNYTRIHKGKVPNYLNYFYKNSNKVLYDQLQSEQGARFLKKRNRNIIIEIDKNDKIDMLDEFIWMTLYQIKFFLRKDNIVNMDTRTVISSIIPHYKNNYKKIIEQNSITELGNFGRNFINVDGNNLDNELNKFNSFIIDKKSEYWIKTKYIDFNELNGWSVNKKNISRYDKKYFEVIGCDITITNREVKNWNQPMIRPTQQGLCMLLSTLHKGVLYFLFQAKVECGNLDIVELAPTVQTLIGDFRKINQIDLPFISYLYDSEARRIFDVLQSEEGGRFYEEENRNTLIFKDDLYDQDIPKDFIWLSLSAINKLIKHNNIFNIQSRSILSILNYYD